MARGISHGAPRFASASPEAHGFRLISWFLRGDEFLDGGGNDRRAT
jgi:hypothetical protein